MPILHTSIIFPNVANDNETLFYSTLYFWDVIEKFYLIQKNVRVIFASIWTNFTDFYDKRLENLYDFNFTLNLIKKNDVKLL